MLIHPLLRTQSLTVLHLAANMASVDNTTTEMEVDPPSGLPTGGTAAKDHDHDMTSTRHASPAIVKIPSHRKKADKRGPVLQEAGEAAAAETPAKSTKRNAKGPAPALL